MTKITKTTITTHADYEGRLEEAIEKIRQGFSQRFSTAYAEKMLDEEVREGLSDLLTNFDGKEQDQLKRFTYQKLQRKFNDFDSLNSFDCHAAALFLHGYVTSYKLSESRFLPLYQGKGFDDEAAFLRKCFAPNNANTEDIDKFKQYQNELKQWGRTFKSADFLLLHGEDEHGKPIFLGSLIYHVLEMVDGKEIVHVRQAFTTKSGGYMNVLLKGLCDKFPGLIGEFNQRWGNQIPLRIELQEKGLLEENKTAVLGYSDKYYSYRTKEPLDSFWKSYQDYLKDRAPQVKEDLQNNNNTDQVQFLQLQC